MVYCYLCTHCSGGKSCGFFKFPEDYETFKKWLNLIRPINPYPPSIFSYICTCHFTLLDYTKGPTIFHEPILIEKVGGSYSEILKICHTMDYDEMSIMKELDDHAYLKAEIEEELSNYSYPKEKMEEKLSDRAHPKEEMKEELVGYLKEKIEKVNII